MLLTFLFFIINNRTTKTSDLPNLSFIMRKPELLGTEFKTLVDAYRGQMLWLEVMEGKEGLEERNMLRNLHCGVMCGERSQAFKSI